MRWILCKIKSLEFSILLIFSIYLFLFWLLILLCITICRNRCRWNYGVFSKPSGLILCTSTIVTKITLQSPCLYDFRSCYQCSCAELPNESPLGYMVLLNMDLCLLTGWQSLGLFQTGTINMLFKIVNNFFKNKYNNHVNSNIMSF